MFLHWIFKPIFLLFIFSTAVEFQGRAHLTSDQGNTSLTFQLHPLSRWLVTSTGFAPCIILLPSIIKQSTKQTEITLWVLNHGEVYPSEKKHKALYCICVCNHVGLASPNEARNNLSKTAPSARRILPAGNRVEKIHID
jgi:hypothetical protein